MPCLKRYVARDPNPRPWSRCTSRSLACASQPRDRLTPRNRFLSLLLIERNERVTSTLRAPHALVTPRTS